MRKMNWGALSHNEKREVRRIWAQVRPKLNGSEYRVLNELIDRMNPSTGVCNPSQTRVAKDTGLSLRSVKEATKTLEARGAIRKHRLPGWSTIHYEIPPFPRLQRHPTQRSN